jgi:mannose-6-phosphate isomerase
MAVEQARTHSVAKPWGTVDLRPWSNARNDGIPIGEIWYERPDNAAKDPLLLLKLLFAKQPLSIQVHPGDSFAHSIGLPSGKTEAWYVLSAASDAKVAVGLNQRLNPRQLREAIESGSILDLVRWQTVVPDDIIFVPAGTIHAIGAGVVIAEIQQRSDATFRLFDYGRQRELHTDRAIAVADAQPAFFRGIPSRLTDSRTLLLSNEHFVFEKVDLAPSSAWYLEAERETWVLVLKGDACVGSLKVGIGDAVFVQSDCVTVQTGSAGLVGLAAYTSGGPAPHLLERINPQVALNAGQPQVRVHLAHAMQSTGAPPNQGRGITQ